MPKAVASSENKRFDLKSLPDGYVVLRGMTYGQTLQRRDMVKLGVEFGKSRQQSAVGELALANKQVSYLEFSWCIVDHNLEKDDNGTKFDFSNPMDVDILDPKIGQEIDKYINEMNNFDTDELKN